jgi:hypothetical protein
MTATWLRGLAQDALEHESCDGCKRNAAQALEHLGALDGVLAVLGVEDPRTTHQRPDSSTDMPAAYTSSLTINWDDDSPPK